MRLGQSHEITNYSAALTVHPMATAAIKHRPKLFSSGQQQYFSLCLLLKKFSLDFSRTENSTSALHMIS